MIVFRVCYEVVNILQTDNSRLFRCPVRQMLGPISFSYRWVWIHTIISLTIAKSCFSLHSSFSVNQLAWSSKAEPSWIPKCFIYVATDLGCLFSLQITVHYNFYLLACSDCSRSKLVGALQLPLISFQQVLIVLPVPAQHIQDRINMWPV